MREIIHCFSLDLTATNTSHLTNISRPTINKYFVLLSLMTRISCLKEFVVREVGMSSKVAKLSSRARSGNQKKKSSCFGFLPSQE
jgi:hypothetical protein